MKKKKKGNKKKSKVNELKAKKEQIKRKERNEQKKNYRNIAHYMTTHKGRTQRQKLWKEKQKERNKKETSRD